jgi:hypothetical protein
MSALNPSVKTRPWQAWTLAAVELFVAYQAVSGGIGLITGTWPMPTEWLFRTPFSDWIGPGWLLIVLIGVPHVLASLVIIVRARQPQPGILAGLLAGVSLVAWIVVQLVFLQRFFFLQPIVVGLGLVEIGLALWWQRRLVADSQRAHSRQSVPAQPAGVE